MVASLFGSGTIIGALSALLSTASPLASMPNNRAVTPTAAVMSESASPAHYPAGALHSPMTRDVVEPLRAILSRSAGRKDVFVKIGDSNTVNPSFLRCFAGHDVRLGAHAELSETLSFFGARRVDQERSSFDRVTEAATVGWLARDAMAGAPSPIEREIAATKPAFAVIMLGTNDNRAGGVEPFAESLAAVVDRTLALGVVPLLSTIPPRTDSVSAAARVPALNAVIRATAESRRVPLMDLYTALSPLRGHGLAKDGIHLQMAYSGAPHGCWLTPSALQQGMNRRNLLTLEALDRARQFLVEGETPEAAPGAEPAGVVAMR